MCENNNNNDNKANGEIIDYDFDGVIMLSEDAVYFNDAKPRPDDGRKVYHIFERYPDSLKDGNGEDVDKKPKLQELQLFCQASEDDIHHIKEVLASNGIAYDEWCPPITPLTENNNIISKIRAREESRKNKKKCSSKLIKGKNKLGRPKKCSKNGKENQRLGKLLGRPKKFSKNGKENQRLGKLMKISASLHSTHKNQKQTLLDRTKIKKSFILDRTKIKKSFILDRTKFKKSTKREEREDPSYVPEESSDPSYCPEERSEVKKIYRCSKCTFWTESWNTFKYHQISHLEKKVLTCSFCSFKTNYKSNLKGHLLTVHDLSQEKCLEEISRVQNVLQVFGLEKSKKGRKPREEDESKDNEKGEPDPATKDEKKKFVNVIKLKKEPGSEDDVFPSYNIVEENTDNTHSEKIENLKLPEVSVLLTRLSPEIVAVYTQRRILKLTLMKLEKTKTGLFAYKLNKVKKAHSILISKQSLISKKKSKYCRIKALRHKGKHKPVILPAILNCSDCCFKTRKKKLLERHILRFHDMMYSCFDCSCSFMSQYELEKHNHSRQEYQCEKCDYSSHSKYRLAKHERSHFSELLFCDKCQFLSSSEEEYLQHLAKHAKPKREKVNIYNCRRCSFTCNDKNELEQHDLSHSDVGLYRCELCLFSTNDEDDFTKHNKRHKIGNLFRCSKCPYKSNFKASVRQHELSHLKAKMFKCSQCDYASNYKGNLHYHQINNHAESKKYKCDECEYSSQFKNYLDLHSISHMEGEILECFFCDFTSDLKTSIRNHIIEEHHTHGVKRSRTNNTKQDYKCKHCGFTTSSRTSYNQHKKTHLSSEEEEVQFVQHLVKQEKVKIYECCRCSFTCSDKNELEQHDLNHLDVALYRCKLCLFSTNNEEDLTTHNFCHEKVTLFKCPKCDYTSTLKASLRQHELSHLEEKMFKCSQCDYATNYKGNLRNHQINNHTESKKYKCDKCEYSAQFKNYLDLHSISHMEGEILECFFCDFTSDLKTSLRSHIIEEHHTQGNKRSRTNNTKQGYKCEQCDFTTSSRTGYNQHKKTHLSEKEHKCPYKNCNYGTNFKGNLLKHFLVHS